VIQITAGSGANCHKMKDLLDAALPQNARNHQAPVAANY
jgi:hypothetical protein